jgi:hypothetical protein
VHPTQQQQQQQQQQRRQGFTCAAMLSENLLLIWNISVRPLCGTDRGSHAIPTAAMLAAARLVVAALQAYPPSTERSRGSSAAWALPSSSSSSRGSSSSSTGSSRRAAARAAAAAAAPGRPAYYCTQQLKDRFDEERLIQTTSLVISNLATAVLYGIDRSFRTALPGLHGAGSAANIFGDPSNIMWVAELGSDRAALADLGVVLYTHLAWMAQLVQGQQVTQAATAAAGAAGVRGSRQQQRRQRQQQQQQVSSSVTVPAWHEDFLAAVHAPPRGSDAARDPLDVMGQMVYAFYQVGMYLDLHLDLHQSMTAALGLSGGPAPSPAFSLAGDRLLDGTRSGIESKLPVRQSLLLLLEVMLLDDMHSTRMNCYKRIAAFLHRLESGPGVNAAAAAATADALLQPVLNLLAPTVLSAPSNSSSSSSSSAAAAASTADTAAEAVAEFAWLVEFLVTTGEHLTVFGVFV